MDVVYKMGHFLMCQVESVESILETLDFGKVVEVSNPKAPRGAETMFHTLKFPQEIVNFLEHDHALICKHSGQR